MAKLPITPPTYAVDNVQQLGDIVIGDAPVVKATHDKTGSDTKDYVVNTLIAELNGPTGANMIGHSNPNIAANNVADAVEEVRQIAVQAQAGSIVDNSLGNIKLSADIKVGSLADLNTTDKDSVTDAINEIDANADTAQATATSANNLATSVSTILNIARTAKTSTGSAVAYAVDTDGVFDLTKDGNRLMFVPNAANSGSCTITTDTNDAKGTRKANDSGDYVVLEANDIKQGVPVEFVWSFVDDFYILVSTKKQTGFKEIARVVVTGTPAQIDFQSLGLENYKFIKILSSVKVASGSSGGFNCALRINDVATTDYRTDNRSLASGGYSSVVTSSGTSITLTQYLADTDPTSPQNLSEILINNVSGFGKQTQCTTYDTDSALGNATTYINNGFARITAAITKLSLICTAGTTFANGSVIILLGVE